MCSNEVKRKDQSEKEIRKREGSAGYTNAKHLRKEGKKETFEAFPTPDSPLTILWRGRFTDHCGNWDEAVPKVADKAKIETRCTSSSEDKQSSHRMHEDLDHKE